MAKEDLTRESAYFDVWAIRTNGELARVEDDGRDAALDAYNQFVVDQLHGRRRHPVLVS